VENVEYDDESQALLLKLNCNQVLTMFKKMSKIRVKLFNVLA